MMQNKLYSFAGIVFKIVVPWEMAESEQFSSFEVHGAEPDFIIDVNAGRAQDYEHEEDYKHVARDGNNIKLLYKPSIAKKAYPLCILNDANAPALITEKGAFVLHSSFVLTDGKAIVFSAPSGTGKSTQAEFWKQERSAEIINGDRTIVSLCDTVFYANGCFLSGSSGYCKNVTAPIKAVVLLGQAKVNQARRISGVEPFARILSEVMIDRTSEDQMKNAVELVSKLISSVPIIEFNCELDPNTVEYLERYL